MEFKINGVPIEDTFCETFTVRIARILVTSVNRKWALEPALETKGLGRSAAIPPSEASIETEAKPEETPDGRPGFIIQFLDRKPEPLKEWFIVRIRKGVMPYPKTNVFDALPKEMAEEAVDIKGTIIQTFGDGFEEETEAFGRHVFRIPRMDGDFHIETRFGIAKGVAGGMFIILAKSDEAALEAAERAVEGTKSVLFVVGKFAASGTKVGGKTYREAIATTNDAYCPSLARNEGSKIPENVKCVYEVIVSGLKLEYVTRAMKVGIENATKVHGVLGITAANYGGTLGKGKILLQSLFDSES
ncbi:formylmethanofuran--tetrahydromethanopterin N-formyltransferase [Candidatus Bathyarchaeota archaeon]|jgi:formylmethanofuran--tetrahydromethanopterin N-formyltransferase|nr:formylmethanofuran--tetrahydromethanopterin N-formyltransferase [Candidatus Bathyarchaeota archaeon]